MFHSLDINKKVDYIHSMQNNRIKDLCLRIIFRNYPDQLDDVGRRAIVSAIVESNHINIKKETRRRPKDAIEEANKILENDDINPEQITIINDYIKYLKSLKA
jgi:hypothetical protein